MRSSPASIRGDWLAAVRAYLGVTAMANLIWEAAHLPLYTIWTTGSPKEQAFAVLHRTAGDVVIALSALTIALTTVGTRTWPVEHHPPVLFVALVIGVAYTAFSEWYNISVRGSWAYSPLMPVVPCPGEERFSAARRECQPSAGAAPPVAARSDAAILCQNPALPRGDGGVRHGVLLGA